MRKKQICLLILLENLLLINTISALNFSLDYLSDDTLSLISTALVFIIFFALINNAVSKKLSSGVSAIISFSLSALILFGALKTGINIPEYFRTSLFSIGVTTEMFYMIVAIVLILILILLIRKLGFGKLLFTIGLILGGITLFTDLIYSKGVAIIISLFFLIIGAWKWKKKYKLNQMSEFERTIYESKKKAKRKEKWEEIGEKWGKRTGEGYLKSKKLAKQGWEFGRDKSKKLIKKSWKIGRNRLNQKGLNVIENEKLRKQQELIAEEKRKAEIQANKEREENNRVIKQKKDLIKKIQAKEAELRKWKRKYLARKDNPKKEHKLKNHVQRLEREFNDLRAQFNKL